jgi:hypothetical protein
MKNTRKMVNPKTRPDTKTRETMPSRVEEEVLARITMVKRMKQLIAIMK